MKDFNHLIYLLTVDRQVAIRPHETTDEMIKGTNVTIPRQETVFYANHNTFSSIARNNCTILCVLIKVHLIGRTCRPSSYLISHELHAIRIISHPTWDFLLSDVNALRTNARYSDDSVTRYWSQWGNYLFTYKASREVRGQTFTAAASAELQEIHCSANREALTPALWVTDALSNHCVPF